VNFIHYSFSFNLSSLAFIFLRLNELLPGLASHVGAIVCANIVYHHPQTALLLIATIDDAVVLELRQEAALPAELTDLDVGFGIVAEEEVLVICICLHPGLQLRVLEQLQVGLRLEVLRLIPKEELLEVSVVPDVGVHAPARMRPLLFLAAEANCEGAHESDELLGAQIALGQSLYDETASIGLGYVLNSITF